MLIPDQKEMPELSLSKPLLCFAAVLVFKKPKKRSFKLKLWIRWTGAEESNLEPLPRLQGSLYLQICPHSLLFDSYSSEGLHTHLCWQQRLHS